MPRGSIKCKRPRIETRTDHRRRNWQPDLKDMINGPNIRRVTGGLRSSELSRFDLAKFGTHSITRMTIIKEES